MTTRNAMLVRALPALSILAIAAQTPAASTTLGPANSIQAAINSDQYDEIILQPGAYFQVVDFKGKPITLRSTDPTDPDVVASTILDGSNLLDHMVTFENGEGPDSVLSGLTIRNGFSSGGGTDERGGGVLIWHASPTIAHCVFEGNSVQLYGGAVYASESGTRFSDCSFVDNFAPHGGAIYFNASNIVMERCSFVANTATSSEGGGIESHGGTLTIVDSEFVMNTSPVAGGAIFQTGGTLKVQRSFFDDNESDRGGAIRTAEGSSHLLENSIFWRNHARVWGGAVYAGGPTAMKSLTMVSNSADSSDSDAIAGNSPGSASYVVNSILWDSGSSPVATAYDLAVTYSLVQGGNNGAGNLNAAPQFVNMAAGDFRLQPSSLAIDAGDATRISGDYPVDYDDNPRAVDAPNREDAGVALLGLSVDMGAFEFMPDGSGPDPDTCLADLDSDASVGFNDLALLLGTWGACPN